MLNLNQKYKRKNETECVISFEADLDEKAVKEIEANALMKLQSMVSLPGFRVGKVPLNLIREKFPSMLKDEVLEIAARQLVSDIIKDEKLYPVVPPKITDVKYEDGKKIQIKIQFEINPTVDPKNYQNIKIVKKVKKIGDKEIEDYINRIREYNAYLKSLEDNAQVGPTHYVIADYEIYENGKKTENGDVKGEIIDMSSPQNIAGLTEAIMGAKKGETKEFTKEFDGKQMKFVVKINDIKEKIVPQLDEEFLKSLGVKDLNELKENVKKILEAQELEKTEREIVKQVEDSLIKDNQIPLPPTVVDEEIKELFEVFKKKSNLEDADKLNLSDYVNTLRPIAERNLRITYLLHNIAKKENITATQEDFNNELNRVLATLKTEEEIKRAKEMFESRKDYIMASIVENKTYNFIKSKAEIKEETL
jgi:trigger factor